MQNKLRLSHLIVSLIFYFALLTGLNSTAFAQEIEAYGPITPKETLGEIAQYVRGTRPLPLKIVVKAIYDANPQAFDGDQSSLMIGSTLFIPDLDRLMEIVPDRLTKPPVPPKLKPSEIGKIRLRGESVPAPVAPVAAPAPLTTPAPQPTPTAIPDVPAEPVENLELANEMMQQIREQEAQIESLTKNNRDHVENMEEMVEKLNTLQRQNTKLQQDLQAERQARSNLQNKTQLLEQTLNNQQSTSTPAPSTSSSPTPLLDLQDWRTWVTLVAILIAILALLSKGKNKKRRRRRSSQSHPDQVGTIIKQPEPSVGSAAETQAMVQEDMTEPMAIKPDPEPAEESKPTVSTASQPEEETFEKEDITEPRFFDDDKEEEAKQINRDEYMDEFDITQPKAVTTVSEDITADEITEEQPEEESSEIKEVEDLLSQIHLHIDMGSKKDATQLLAEIDTQRYPQYVDTVNELGTLIEDIDPDNVSTGYTMNDANALELSDDIRSQLKGHQYKSEENSHDTPELNLEEPDIESTHKVDSLDEAIVEDPLDTTAKNEALELDIVESDLDGVEKTHKVDSLDEPIIDDELDITAKNDALDLDIPEENTTSNEAEDEEWAPDFELTPNDHPATELHEDSEPSYAPLNVHDEMSSSFDMLQDTKLLQEQLKLADTYLELGERTRAKEYVAKVLQHESHQFREEAIEMLRKIEATRNEELETLDDLFQPKFDDDEDDEERSDKTVLTAKPNNTPPSEDVTQKMQALPEFDEVVPADLSSCFEAYSESEDGTKLALAYLSLDIGNTEMAKGFLKEVIAGDDPALATEASLALDKI